MRGEGGNDQVRFGCRITQIVDEEYTAVRKRVAMDQCADVAVFRDEDALLCSSFCQQGCVTGIGLPLAHEDHIVASGTQRAHGLCHDVGVRKDTHAIRRRW